MENDNVNAGSEKEGTSGAGASGVDEKARSEYLQAFGEDLPEETQNKLWESHQKTQAELKARDEKLQKVENVARNFQAEKDRYFATLQKHNLTPDGRPATPPVEESPAFKEIVQALQREAGIPLDQAEKAAKVQMAMFEPLQRQVLQQVGNYMSPVTQTVGSIQADSILAQIVAQDKSGYYNDPEIQGSVRQSLQEIIQTGGEYNPTSVQWLFDSEIGKRQREGKLKTATPLNMSTHQFNTRSQFPMNGGTAGNIGFQQNQQAPVPTTVENGMAWSKIAPHLFKGTSKDPANKGVRR